MTPSRLPASKDRSKFFILLLMFFGGLRSTSADITAPLKSFNMHPLYTPFIQTLPLSAGILQQSQFELGVLQSYGNNFFLTPSEEDDSVIIADLDSESSYTAIHTRWGLGRNLEVALMLQGRLHYGGFLDPLISSFHDLLYLPNGGREYRENNQVTFYLAGESEPILDINEGNLSSLAAEGELRLGVLDLLSPSGGDWSGSIGLFGKLPLAGTSHPLNEGGADWGFRGIATYRRDGISVDISLGCAFLERPEYLAEEHFRSTVLPFFLSFGWKMREGIALITTIQGSSSPFRLDYKRADRFSATANFGSRIRMGTADFLAISFTEEFFTFAATDIGFHLEWVREFEGHSSGRGEITNRE